METSGSREVLRNSTNQEAMMKKLEADFAKKTAAVVGPERLEVALKVLSGEGRSQDIRDLTADQQKAINARGTREGKEAVTGGIKREEENPAIRAERERVASELAQVALRSMR